MMVLAGCSNPLTNLFRGDDDLMPADAGEYGEYEYLVGPGDTINVFVWRNPDVSGSAVVRPDGKVTLPLVEDLQASGRTTRELARDIEKALSEYIRDPLVSVTAGGFQGDYRQTVRVLGEAAKPLTLPFRENMSVLDVMIAVGGLTDYAAGNRATIIRETKEGQLQKRVRLEDLIRDGDISANVQMAPGDVMIIPEAWF
jgi:polysaccharide export outer membrane protein